MPFTPRTLASPPRSLKRYPARFCALKPNQTKPNQTYTATYQVAALTNRRPPGKQTHRRRSGCATKSSENSPMTTLEPRLIRRRCRHSSALFFHARELRPIVGSNVAVWSFTHRSNPSNASVGVPGPFLGASGKSSSAVAPAATATPVDGGGAAAGACTTLLSGLKRGSSLVKR